MIFQADPNVVEVKNKFAAAIETFLGDTEALEEAIDNATSQQHGGSSTWEVELFADGTYRTDWRRGNLYNTPGIIVAIPTLRADQEAIEDENGDELAPAYYDDAIEELRRNFEYASGE